MTSGRVRSEGFLCRDKLKYRVLMIFCSLGFLTTPQVTIPYSICGLTRELYTSRRMFTGKIYS